MIRSILILLLATFSVGLFAQKNAKIRVNNEVLYLKSLKKISNSSNEYCVACADAKMSKKCKNFLKTGANSYTQTSISESELNLIATKKSIQSLAGLKYEKLNDEISIPYLQKGDRRVYFMGSGKNLIIDEYAVPEEDVIVAGKTISTMPDHVMHCQVDCHNSFINCKKRCLRNPERQPIAEGDISSCWDGCILSAVACARACNALAAISHIELINFIDIPVIKLNN